MNENVITIEECRKRAQQGSFDALRTLEAAPLRLVSGDELREVSAGYAECKWNTQQRRSKSKGKVYILVCLPLVLTIVYMLLARRLRLW